MRSMVAMVMVNNGRVPGRLMFYIVIYYVYVAPAGAAGAKRTPLPPGMQCCRWFLCGLYIRVMRAAGYLRIDRRPYSFCVRVYEFQLSECLLFQSTGSLCGESNLSIHYQTLCCVFMHWRPMHYAQFNRIKGL